MILTLWVCLDRRASLVRALSGVNIQLIRVRVSFRCRSHAAISERPLVCFDGTPLYRLAQAFERADVPVSRGALGHWVIGSSEKHLSRIYDALKLRLRSQPLIHGDETTVQVLKEMDREAASTSYMWQ